VCGGSEVGRQEGSGRRVMVRDGKVGKVEMKEKRRREAGREGTGGGGGGGALEQSIRHGMVANNQVGTCFRPRTTSLSTYLSIH
jgi:hypothetical protein